MNCPVLLHLPSISLVSFVFNSYFLSSPLQLGRPLVFLLYVLSPLLQPSVVFPPLLLGRLFFKSSFPSVAFFAYSSSLIDSANLFLHFSFLANPRNQLENPPYALV